MFTHLAEVLYTGIFYIIVFDILTCSHCAVVVFLFIFWPPNSTFS